MSAYLKLCAGLVLAALLSACAEPIPKARITPVYKGQALDSLSVGMTDHRTFILSADKEPWFEGIFHGAYGLPNSPKRPGPKERPPFAIYLSGMLAGGLRANGTDVLVIAVRPGVDMDKAIYKNTLDEVLDDREVMDALGRLVAVPMG